MRKIKGFTLVETLAAATLGIAVTLGGTMVIKSHEDNKIQSERNITTAGQLLQFSEASYKLSSSIDTLPEGGKITLQDLKDKEFLGDSFPEHTPYGQTIKGFYVKNSDDNDYVDILVTTTGRMNEDYLEQVGQNKETVEMIQQKTYNDIRREKLDLSSDTKDNYEYGMVKDKEFNSVGNLYSRNISGFSSDLGTDELQVGVLLVAPHQKTNLTKQLQAMNADPAEEVPANGKAKADLQASARYNDGTPVKNQTIQWSTSIGNLKTKNSDTNNNGVAENSITSSVAGSASIKAIVEGASKSIIVNFVPPEVSSILASPKEEVNADGKMCSNLTAVIAYSDGTLADNEGITWSTNFGSLKNKVNKTNNKGQVTACLYSAKEGNATASVKVNRSNDSDNVGVEFIGARIENSNISATPTKDIPADGVEYSTIKVKATYPDGSPASGKKITWSTNKGSLNNSSTTTNSNGETSVRLTSTQSGGAIVKATVPQGQSRQVTVIFDDPVIMGLSASPTENIAANNDATSTFKITLKYPNGKKASGETVTWSTSRGTLSSAKTTTNSNGQTNVTLKSNSDGGATVVAKIKTGATKSKTVKFVPPKLVDVYASKTVNVPADGKTQVLISAKLEYPRGEVAKNEIVNWSANGGSLSNKATRTNNSGIASVYLTSAVAKTVQVKASYGGVNQNAGIVFIGPQINNNAIWASPSSGVASDNSDTSTVKVRVTYGDSIKASGVTVQWSTSKGSLSSSKTTTNSNGETSVSLKSNSAGTAKVTAVVANGSRSINVNFDKYGLTALTVNKTSGLAANNSDKATFTAVVKYPNGRAAKNATASWSTSRGSLSSGSTKTDSNGKATVTLRSSSAGNAKVTARISTGDNRAQTVKFDSASLVNISANKTSNIPANGSDKSTISAVVQYPNGKRASNVVVNWSSNGGKLSNSATRTNSNGVASTYLSSNKVGTFRVNASYGGATKSINIKFKNNKSIIVFPMFTTPDGNLGPLAGGPYCISSKFWEDCEDFYISIVGEGDATLDQLFRNKLNKYPNQMGLPEYLEINSLELENVRVTNDNSVCGEKCDFDSKPSPGFNINGPYPQLPKVLPVYISE